MYTSLHSDRIINLKKMPWNSFAKFSKQTNLEGQYSRGLSEFRTTSILIEAETVSRSGEILCQSGIWFPFKNNVHCGQCVQANLDVFTPQVRSNLDVFHQVRGEFAVWRIRAASQFSSECCFSKQLLRVVAGLFAPTLTRVTDSVVSFLVFRYQ